MKYLVPKNLTLKSQIAFMLFGDRYSQNDIQTDTDPQTTPVYISLWHGVKISTNSMDTT